MTSAAAREILLLYRPGTADATEPEVVEALEEAPPVVVGLKVELDRPKPSAAA